MTAALQTLIRQGYEALGRGNPGAAAKCCQQALGMDPACVPAHFLTGLVASAAGDRVMAINAFGSVTRLQPEHAAAWSQLARLFIQSGQPNRADQALARAVEHVGDEPLVFDVIGTVYSQLGDQQSARHWYGRAVAAQPDNPAFQVNLANACVFLGESDEAVSVLEKLLASHPHIAQAHWLLATSRKATDREHITRMVEEVARGNRTGHDFAFLYYGLGKAFEDLEEWDRAFEAFSRGAKARRVTLNFDESAEEEAFRVAEATFTPEWLSGQTRGPENPAPIFVVGLPRTGTTLVERIITSHSAVGSAGELQQFGLSIRRELDEVIPGRFSARLFEAAAGVDAAAVGAAYLNVTQRFRGEEPHFVDKLPSNYRFIPLILAALPRAKIVHLVRNPMDACFASFKQLFADAYQHSYDQGEMARHYVRYHRQMDVWRERFPGRFFDIAYEAVAGDLEPNARALISFLELPWEDACLQFHQQSGAVATASAVQVREGAHTRSVGRWRRYERQLQPMRDILQEAGIEV